MSCSHTKYELQTPLRKAWTPSYSYLAYPMHVRHDERANWCTFVTTNVQIVAWEWVRSLITDNIINYNVRTWSGDSCSYKSSLIKLCLHDLWSSVQLVGSSGTNIQHFAGSSHKRNTKYWSCHPEPPSFDAEIWLVFSPVPTFSLHQPVKNYFVSNYSTVKNGKHYSAVLKFASRLQGYGKMKEFGFGSPQGYFLKW